jgi:hypothetical protein
MNVEVFDPLPTSLFERLVSFSQSRLGTGWKDIHRMIAHLTAHFPGTVFREEPYFYLDLKTKRSGLLFIEQESERLYFVYETGIGRTVSNNRDRDG